jgi:hypothetical protein
MMTRGATFISPIIQSATASRATIAVRYAIIAEEDRSWPRRHFCRLGLIYLLHLN